jgi:hypothetical protein
VGKTLPCPWNQHQNPLLIVPFVRKESKIDDNIAALVVPIVLIAAK